MVRRGFFTDTNLGTFFTLGGNDQYSNAQSYVQLGLGYDLFDFLAVGAHVAFGSNAFNCFAGRVGGACARSDAFTVTFFDASLTYLHRLGNRFYLTPKVVAGYTLLDPEPVSGQSQGFNLGAGIGVEYATAMDHFSVGADVLGRYVLGANIPTVAIFPRVKYTF
ncbi:MAG: adventurous gliding motility protein CglE [Myxococcota bacterium]|nr:adventurous gliding motility protein CglE [Myxococcota bacterium]